MKAPIATPEQQCERATTLSYGRQLTIRVAQPDAPGGPADLLEVRSASGELELAIEVGPAGPRLRVRAVDIELCAEKGLTMRCDRLEVAATSSASIASGGLLALSGDDVRVQADTGEVTIRANDDVDVRGERIRLNCDDPPMPATWAELEERVRSEKAVR